MFYNFIFHKKKAKTMSTRLYMGICNTKRWEKAMKIIEDRNAKRPNAIKHPVCSVDQALQNPDVQKHFTFQRAQISGYERQEKIANNKNVGNLTRDVKSLVVPYLFATVVFKPTELSGVVNTSSSSAASAEFKTVVTMSQYGTASANASRYFVNIFVAGFKPEARERGKRRRVPPFNRQLQYYWIGNKKEILKNAMDSINKDPDAVYKLAVAYESPSEIEKKKEVFKRDFALYRHNRIKGRNIYGDNSLLTQRNARYNDEDEFYDENDEEDEEGRKDKGEKKGGGGGS